MNLVVHSPRLWLGNQATWQKIWKKNGECLRVENERIASVREKQKTHRFDTDPYLERQDEFLKYRMEGRHIVYDYVRAP